MITYPACYTYDMKIKRLKKTVADIHPLVLWTSGVAVIFVLVVGFLFYRGYTRIANLAEENEALGAKLEAVEGRLASSTEALQVAITDTHSSLARQLDSERSNLQNIRQELQQEVGDISGTVTTLEKLAKTEEELLQKYSRVFFLNEHYSPPRLTELPDAYEYYEDRHMKVDSRIWPYLQNMLDAAADDGKELYVYSSYRSFNEQGALNDQYTVTYGEGTANQFSAEQGYSEHQLGTTVDLITTGIGGTLRGFEETDDYRWLLENAHKYGFILSYPEGNDYYIFEPWHWRFVGVELATHLHDTGQQFYDLDQREIDEYLVSLFE